MLVDVDGSEMACGLIYICCCLLSFLLLDPPLSPPPLSLPSLDTSLARPLSPFVCRPSEASTCIHACMHTAAYTFISDIFLLLLLMMIDENIP